MEQRTLINKLKSAEVEDDVYHELWAFLSLEKPISIDLKEILDDWFFNTNDFMKLNLSIKGLFESLKLTDKKYTARLKYLLENADQEFGIYYDEVISITQMYLSFIFKGQKDKDVLKLYQDVFQKYRHEDFPANGILKSMLVVWGIPYYQVSKRLNHKSSASIKKIENKFKKELKEIRNFINTDNSGYENVKT